MRMVDRQRPQSLSSSSSSETVTVSGGGGGGDESISGGTGTGVAGNGNGNLHVIMEHFSFELQHLLDSYLEDEIDFDTLLQKYHQLGSENHDLQPYKDLFEDAKRSNLATTTNMDNDLGRLRRRKVHLHAGFLPRRFARMLLRDGQEATFEAASQWLPSPFPVVEGTEFHYNIFESLLSGRSLSSNTNNVPSDQFRRIFQAQVLKDEAMAHRVSTLIQESASSSSSSTTEDDDSEDKFLVIAGNGHMLHYTGVPERVLKDNPHLAKETCLVVSESVSSEMFTTTPGDDDESKSDPSTNDKISSFLKRRFGPPGSNPADFVFLYEIPDEVLRMANAVGDEHSSSSSNEANNFVKEETKKAYDKVGDTAGYAGNALKAAWIMYNLGYSEHDYKTAGPDAYNFQGVGNPHTHASIRKGEIVLDVGSGLGIDSIIANDAVGPDGLVIGIDVSEKEVFHATKRAQERKLDNNLKFVVGDMENIPKSIPDGSIDVIISNGAFCLAPNKERAFAELYRVLRPGGRISVCTTTVQNENELEPGVSWPLCMKMFISKDAIKPMCEKIGFGDVVVDDSDSRMSMEIPEEVLEHSNPSRSSVHVGSDEFKHLEGYDMDKICARVCVVARKPVISTNTGETNDDDGSSPTTKTSWKPSRVNVLSSSLSTQE
mmetsp:Transcript_19363/g.46788  ORF Transcript_19363/g.46788 Transcript_19363/m.46788 type:complete len:659 (-) Transcript_19363:77-2053(-)